MLHRTFEWNCASVAGGRECRVCPRTKPCPHAVYLMGIFYCRDAGPRSTWSAWMLPSTGCLGKWRVFGPQRWERGACLHWVSEAWVSNVVGCLELTGVTSSWETIRVLGGQKRRQSRHWSWPQLEMIRSKEQPRANRSPGPCWIGCLSLWGAVRRSSSQCDERLNMAFSANDFLRIHNIPDLRCTGE